MSGNGQISVLKWYNLNPVASMKLNSHLFPWLACSREGCCSMQRSSRYRQHRGSSKEGFFVSFTWSLLDRLSEVPRCLQKPSLLNGDCIWGILDPGQILACMILTSLTIPAVYGWHWFWSAIIQVTCIVKFLISLLIKVKHFVPINPQFLVVLWHLCLNYSW